MDMSSRHAAHKCPFPLPDFLHKNAIETSVSYSDWLADRREESLTSAVPAAGTEGDPSKSGDLLCYSEKSSSSMAFVNRLQLISSKCRLLYDLSAFPFDCQELQTILFLLPSAGLRWDLKLLDSERAVQAFEASFRNPEWELVGCSVAFDRTPAGQRVVLTMRIRRLWQW